MKQNSKTLLKKNSKKIDVKLGQQKTFMSKTEAKFNDKETWRLTKKCERWKSDAKYNRMMITDVNGDDSEE